MNLTEQLKRDGNLLRRPEKTGPKPKRFLKRTVRPRQVSSKRAKEGRVYSVKRKAYLEAHPKCQAYDIIAAEWRLNEGQGIPDHWPQSCPPSVEIHHKRKPKCKYLNDESTWLAVCRWSHEFIEANKSTARALSLLD